MSKIKLKEIENIAQLARLEMPKAELKRHLDEISSILDYMELINQAEISGVEPMTNITGLSNVFRGDEKEPSKLTRDELLANTPDKTEGYIKVKPILE